jgi:hypothetical protein
MVRSLDRALGELDEALVSDSEVEGSTRAGDFVFASHPQLIVLVSAWLDVEYRLIEQA